MKFFLLLFYIFTSFGYAQDSTKTVLSPCEDPLIKLAKNKGIKSIPIKDIYRYRRLLKACKEQEGVEKIEEIYKNDWYRDFQKSKVMASWTSTHAMCVFVSFAYYFAGKVLATKPENS